MKNEIIKRAKQAIREQDEVVVYRNMSYSFWAVSDGDNLEIEVYDFANYLLLSKICKSPAQLAGVVLDILEGNLCF